AGSGLLAPVGSGRQRPADRARRQPAVWALVRAKPAGGDPAGFMSESRLGTRGPGTLSERSRNDEVDRVAPDADSPGRRVVGGADLVLDLPPALLVGHVAWRVEAVLA